MVLIEITFPAGRYHATPWARHVNEGAVEWPPSPWRLLRTLIAVYWRKHRELDLNVVKSLIERLAATPPQYALPKASGAHTRHYMPLFKERTAKIFDAFLHIENNGALLICWSEVELDASQRNALTSLLTGMGYLGRAESWVEARLLPDDMTLPAFNALPVDNPYSEPPKEFEAERVLCAVPQEEYLAWHDNAYAEEKIKREQKQIENKRSKAIEKGKDPDTVTLTNAEILRISSDLDALFPATLFDALHTDTGILQSQGWSAAPGSHCITYFRPPVHQALAIQKSIKRERKAPTTIRIALAPDTVNADTRPRVQDTLYLGEQIRRATMNLSRTISEEHGDSAPQCAPIFSGKDMNGNRLDKNHNHAFFLPCDDDGDKRIDHVLIYARDGFTLDEVEAVGRLKNLWQYGGRPGLLIVYLGEGSPEDFGGFKQRNDESPFLAKSRTWHSHTPYVPIRHGKRSKRGEPKLDINGNWIDSPEMQIRKELELRGIPMPESIEPYARNNSPAEWRHFATRRKQGGGTRAQQGCMGFRLQFSTPVRGPIALGYGCHFGLGLFVAEPGDS